MVNTAEVASPPKQTPPPIEPLLAALPGVTRLEAAQGAGGVSESPAPGLLGPKPGEQVVTIVSADPAHNSFVFKVEPMRPAQLTIVPGQFSPDFGATTAAALRRLEDLAFVHQPMSARTGGP